MPLVSNCFKDINILPIQSQCILDTFLVTKNKDQFLSNSRVHKMNTRQTFDLYIPTANVTIYQKGVYYLGIKIYNHLSTAIKDLSDDKNQFKLALKITSYIISFTVWRNILIHN
jgi:hypothetical protein